MLTAIAGGGGHERNVTSGQLHVLVAEASNFFRCRFELHLSRRSTADM